MQYSVECAISRGKVAEVQKNSLNTEDKNKLYKSAEAIEGKQDEETFEVLHGHFART